MRCRVAIVALRLIRHARCVARNAKRLLRCDYCLARVAFSPVSFTSCFALCALFTIIAHDELLLFRFNYMLRAFRFFRFVVCVSLLSMRCSFCIITGALPLLRFGISLALVALLHVHFALCFTFGLLLVLLLDYCVARVALRTVDSTR